MYTKELYVYQNNKPIKTSIRNYVENDFPELIRIQRESFPPPFPSELWWNEEQLTNHITLFQEGAKCIEVNGEMAGSITGLLVDFNPEHPKHTWEEVTDNGYIRNHRPEGNTLYIVDICVRPKFRKLDLGKHLMQSMYDVVLYKNLDRLLGGGRMPNYYKYANKLSPKQYLDSVVKGDIKDPVISFLLRCGRTPITVIDNYLDDEESYNNAVLMEWKNPFKSWG